MVSNGQELVEIYKASPSRFNAIVTDIDMPILNGIKATLKIRKFEKKNDIPETNVVVLTCNSTAKIKNAAKNAGVNEFLTKPLN